MIRRLGLVLLSWTLWVACGTSGRSIDVIDAAEIDAAEIDAVVPNCLAPDGPRLSPIPVGTELVFHVQGLDAPLEVAHGSPPIDPSSVSWTTGSTLILTQPGAHQVQVRMKGCDDPIFDFTYTAVTELPGVAGADDSNAISEDNEAIVEWAESATDAQQGEDVSEEFDDVEKCLGPATGNPSDVYSLGRGGSVTLEFDPAITNGPGADLAVFENGFSDTFLELATVWVSSDGETFIPFDTLYLLTESVGPFSTMDPQGFYGFAGRYRGGYGTPFDLSQLLGRTEVNLGLLDLTTICCVRIVDVVGDGSEVDSFGHPVYDPYPTSGGAGFDLDAVAALNVLESSE